jgi:putative nucleotidyltransferase with HDIG domain
MSPDHGELLTKLVERSRAVAFVWKLEDGWPVVYVSENVSQFGYSADDFMSGRTDFRDIIHPDDEPRIASEVAHHFGSGHTEFVQQYRLVMPTGVVRWIRDWTYIDQLGGRQVAQGVILDITDEIDLKDRVFRIAESVPGAIFHHRFHPDGTETGDFMSAGCQEIWELSPEELLRKPELGWAMVVPEDRAGLHASVQHAIKHLSRWEHEFRIVTPSGVKKWLRGHGRPTLEPDGVVGSMTVVMDITSSKAADEAIAAGLRKTIHALAAVIEARDPYTAGHEDMVARLAVLIGRELGLSEHALTGLELAASVHDIGKIAIPAEILSKPGRLSPVEYELVKSHAQRGADLLRPIQFPWPIDEIVEQHHERCDGSGYPKGLHRRDILLEARILGVADTLEAMANHRPYRPALGMARAMETVAAGAGTLFDSEVVEACTGLYARGAFATLA